METQSVLHFLQIGEKLPNLSGCFRNGLSTVILVIPGQPCRGIAFDRLGMHLQGNQIIHWIAACLGTRDHQAHEHIAHVRTICCPVKKGGLAVADRNLQRPLYHVIV